MNFWVVVVDDEIVSLTNAKNILAGEGMKVSRLRSGRDLLKFMEKNKPDLILLDVMMPEMDGFQTYHALRQLEEDEGRKRTPVIFLTGAEDSEIEHRGLKAGASDFIHKPFNKDIMIHRIRNIITNAKVIETLRDEASIDKLTGFWSRAAGMKRIGEFCRRKDGTMAILDLDNFKLVNDLHGHDMGDRVLETFAEVIRHNVREDDVVARIGGDEFLAFFTNMNIEAGLASLIRRLNEQFVGKSSEILGGSTDIPLGISMGAVKVPDYGREYDILFPLADSALYRAKHNGKHDYVLYVPDADMEISREENLQREIERITQIVEERSVKGGALLLGIEQFSFVYRFIKRFGARYGGKAGRILFMLSGEDSDILRNTVWQFGECLQKTLRRSDIILHNKLNQYFLFLPELDEEDVPAVLGRIKEAWEAQPHDDSIRIEHVFEPVVYDKQQIP